MDLNLTAKAETRKTIFHNLGCDADDWLEAAKKQAAGFEGAKHALRESAKNVTGIAAAVTQDMDDGKLEGLGPLEVAEYAKKQLTRVVASLAAQAQHFENLQLSALGEIAALDRVVKHFAKLHEAEATKITKIQEALASGEIQLEDGALSQSEVGARLPGVRPASGIAAQRKAEEAAAAKGATTTAVEEPKKVVKEPKVVRKCGHCGKPGHTARGCPEKKK